MAEPDCCSGIRLSLTEAGQAVLAIASSYWGQHEDAAAAPAAGSDAPPGVQGAEQAAGVQQQEEQQQHQHQRLPL
jgi:hypothetical protein